MQLPPFPSISALPPALLLLPLLLVQAWFWLRYFQPFVRRPPEAAATEPGPDTQPVSVIVCAHNELDNLRELVPLLLSQNYPAGYELVLIDDRSDDETQLFAQQVAQYYPGRFRLVSVAHTPAGFSPKKYALTLGIKAAAHERLLFLDADCRPHTTDWLQLMQRGFAQRGGADLVLGFSDYEEQPGLLNLLVRVETLVTANQYLSLAWAGHPYMGVGRNLAYTRATFRKTKGFASHIRRLSGDDDLLVQDAVALGARAAVVADPAAHTRSQPVQSWGAWWRQKRRHLSAGTRYRAGDRRRLGLYMGTNALFYLLLPVLAFGCPTLLNVVSLAVAWGLQATLIWAAYVPLARRMDQRLPVAALPLLHFLYLVLYSAWGTSVLFKRPLQWK